MTEPAPSSPDPTRTAVVLCSSFLGVYAHAGFLNGLADAGFAPARLSGASAGALAGAFFACGLRGDALRDAALDDRLRRSFLDPGCLWRLPGVATSLWSTGIFHGRRTVKYLRRRLGERDLAEFDSPALDIAVTNVSSARAESLRRGPLAELVVASCAVPALFTVQEIGGERYLDGGIAAEHPYEHLLDESGIDTILIHRIRHEENSGPTVNWENASSIIGISHETTSNELHRLRSRGAEERGKRLVEIRTETPFPGVFSNRRAPGCYERGYRTAADFLRT